MNTTHSSNWSATDRRRQHLSPNTFTGWKNHSQGYHIAQQPKYRVNNFTYCNGWQLPPHLLIPYKTNVSMLKDNWHMYWQYYQESLLLPTSLSKLLCTHTDTNTYVYMHVDGHICTRTHPWMCKISGNSVLLYFSKRHSCYHFPYANSSCSQLNWYYSSQLQRACTRQLGRLHYITSYHLHNQLWNVPLVLCPKSHWPQHTLSCPLFTL